MLTKLKEQWKHYLKTFDTDVFGGEINDFAKLKMVPNKDPNTLRVFNTN